MVASLPAAGLKRRPLRHDQLTRARRYAEAPFGTNWGPAVPAGQCRGALSDRHRSDRAPAPPAPTRWSPWAPTRLRERAATTPLSSCPTRPTASSVTDFDGQGAGQGDTPLIFSGFGTAAQGATFTSLGHDQWQIYSGLDAHNETVTLGNGASIHATRLFLRVRPSRHYSAAASAPTHPCWRGVRCRLAASGLCRAIPSRLARKDHEKRKVRAG